MVLGAGPSDPPTQATQATIPAEEQMLLATSWHACMARSVLLRDRDDAKTGG